MNNSHESKKENKNEYQKIQDPFEEKSEYIYEINKSNYSANAFITYGTYGPISSFHQNILNYSSLVSVKKICKAYETPSKGKNILREISIISFLDHPNVIKLIDLVIPEKEDWQNIYFIEDYMGTNLERLIESNYNYLLDPKLVPWLIYQILLGLNYLHSSQIMHRDIKPSNILIDEKANIKICGFNSARSFNDYENTLKGETSNFTSEIGSLSYKAPEVLSSKKKDKSNYDNKIDIWGVGCIMAELYTKIIPFFPMANGKKTWDSQLIGIFEKLGKPNKEELEDFAAKERIKDIFKFKEKTKPDLKNIFPNVYDLDTLDLLQKLLTINPKKRISIKEAIQHPYFDIIREYIYEDDVNESNFIYENDFENKIEEIEKKNAVFNEQVEFYKNEIYQKYRKIKDIIKG